MPDPVRKMSEILKEMSERLLRNPDGDPSSGAAHIALMFANIAWNEGIGVIHPRDRYREAWEVFEAENPTLWSELKSNDVDALIDELVAFKRKHHPNDQRRILACGIPDGKVRVEWLDAAEPGINPEWEMQLYGLVRVGELDKAIQFLQETWGVPADEAIRRVVRIASGLRGK